MLNVSWSAVRGEEEPFHGLEVLLTLLQAGFNVSIAVITLCGFFYIQYHS